MGKPVRFDCPGWRERIYRPVQQSGDGTGSGAEVVDMTSFFVQGQSRVVPAINPEFAHSIVPETLEPYGLERIGCYADQGGTVMKISQTVEGPTAREAVERFRARFDDAERRRQQQARAIRFSLGAFEPEWVSEWSADGTELGPPQPWTPARLSSR